MLRVLRKALSIVTFLLASYGLITKNFEFNYFMIFLLGLTMLIFGLEEFRKERKMYGWLMVVVFLFSLFVSIQGFLLK
ncbi:YczI family protein [Bacillus sp. ISL-18]|nr:YczI family protein [Bacillus sp. ISL-18]